MSVVSTVILSVPLDTDISFVQDYLNEEGKGYFNQVDQHCGGKKDVYLAAFNYLKLSELVNKLETFTLMVQGQDEDVFTIAASWDRSI